MEIVVRIASVRDPFVFASDGVLREPHDGQPRLASAISAPVCTSAWIPSELQPQLRILADFLASVIPLAIVNRRYSGPKLNAVPTMAGQPGRTGLASVAVRS
jgi:hypothetical protein